MYELYDMHCHLDFASNAQEVAVAAFERGVGAFCCTVEPWAYDGALAALCGCPNVRCGIGMHPWWVADGRVDDEGVDYFFNRVRDVSYVGEVGLDFGARHGNNRELQIRAFERVLEGCDVGGKILSVHAVKAAGEVLELFEHHKTLESNVCIFHWFSGSSDQLTRAIRSGCYFSVNEMMLETKRGAEYLKAIPVCQLLIETDLFEEDTSKADAKRWLGSLSKVAEIVARVKGRDALPAMAETSHSLLGFGQDEAEARHGGV